MTFSTMARSSTKPRCRVAEGTKVMPSPMTKESTSAVITPKTGVISTVK